MSDNNSKKQPPSKEKESDRPSFLKRHIGKIALGAALATA
jgi:hypothetical protein